MKQSIVTCLILLTLMGSASAQNRSRSALQSATPPLQSQSAYGEAFYFAASPLPCVGVSCIEGSAYGEASYFAASPLPCVGVSCIEGSAYGEASYGAQESQDCAEAKANAARLEARLKDWPALGRYRDMNGSLPTPAGDENRAVFLGDSITDGWKLASYFPGKPYVNRGISGQTTPQMLIRFRPDVIALKPKIVVILAGTNDIGGNTGPTTLPAIEDNLVSMIELARAGGIGVVVASVLPVNDSGKDKDGKTINRTTRRPPEQIQALNEWMKKYAAQNDLIYLDYFSAMVDAKGFLKEDLSGDGLHPNEKGYAVMAPLVEQAIATAIKKKR